MRCASLRGRQVLMTGQSLVVLRSLAQAWQVETKQIRGAEIARCGVPDAVDEIGILTRRITGGI